MTMKNLVFPAARQTISIAGSVLDFRRKSGLNQRMGAFITNYHVRAQSMRAVREAVAGLAQARAYVSPPQNGWVTTYDEASDEQDISLLRSMGSGLSEKLRAQFDRTAREMLKNTSGNLPSFEELKDARDKNPEALAELISTRAREHLTDIAVCAIPTASKAFIAALLKQGLDPNSRDCHGLTPLSVAQRRPEILQMLTSTSAAD